MRNIRHSQSVRPRRTTKESIQYPCQMTLPLLRNNRTTRMIPRTIILRLFLQKTSTREASGKRQLAPGSFNYCYWTNSIDSARVISMPALRCDSPDRNNHRSRHWGGASSESAREEQVGLGFGQCTCCHLANAGVSQHICPCSVSNLAVASHHLLTCFFTHTYSVFQFVMAVDAVYARNTLQFLCLTYVFGSYQVAAWLTFRVF